MAGGFRIKKENISIFRDFLIKNFNNLQLNKSKNHNLHLDAKIAPSAMNEDFYKEINVLAPFGSGNNEPKFMIENLKVIKSEVVANQHIKSLLLGLDGSVFKGMAWNAKDTPLESYLQKGNKKKFNIAGKMKLNEWRGKKDIEFMIEDISIN